LAAVQVCVSHQDSAAMLVPSLRSVASLASLASTPAPGLAWIHRLGSTLAAAARGGVRVVAWSAHHSGLPAVLVAALAVVLSWRLIKRGARLALEVVIAAALLVVATRLGWLSW
jgi:hypothetical protein